MEALKDVYEHDEEAHDKQLSAQERLTYHQTYSGPIMEELEKWLEQQTTGRLIEPNSSLGKAIAYLLGHWETLTRFLTEPGAPLDNNVAERALKLCIRQRKNSLFGSVSHLLIGVKMAKMGAEGRTNNGRGSCAMSALSE